MTNLNPALVVSYTYDNNGNLQTAMDSSGTTTYGWDYENRLTSVTQGTKTSTFKYDPFGRRIEENAANAQMQWIYVYDGDNVFERLDLTGVSQRKFTMGLGIDEPLATYQAITSGFYDQDGLGSVTSISNNTGALQASYTYDSFGNITGMTGPRATQFLFTGREYDSPNQYYYRARYYNPVLGRFISEDPMRFDENVNFYPYARNHPVDFVDPSGLLVELRCERVQRYWLGYLGAIHCRIRVACNIPKPLDETFELEGPLSGSRHGNPRAEPTDPSRPNRLSVHGRYPVRKPSIWLRHL